MWHELPLRVTVFLVILLSAWGSCSSVCHLFLVKRNSVIKTEVGWVFAWNVQQHPSAQARYHKLWGRQIKNKSCNNVLFCTRTRCFFLHKKIACWFEESNGIQHAGLNLGHYSVLRRSRKQCIFVMFDSPSHSPSLIKFWIQLDFEKKV